MIHSLMLLKGFGLEGAERGGRDGMDPLLLIMCICMYIYLGRRQSIRTLYVLKVKSVSHTLFVNAFMRGPTQRYLLLLCSGSKMADTLPWHNFIVYH